MNNSSASMNPDGGDSAWRDDREPALDNLMGRILEGACHWRSLPQA
jgi:hypothetical protein